MWHRSGGLIVTAPPGAQRVEEQDWSTLTLEAFPAATAQITERRVYERDTATRTLLSFETFGNGRAQLHVSAPEGGAPRAWVLRLHLRPGQQAAAVHIDGVRTSVAHIAPLASEIADSFFPLGGAGTPPASQAGPVAEIHIPAAATARLVEVQLLDA